MASPTVRRRQLSAVLRQMRQSAGLSLDAVAARLEWSRAKVGHIETGQRERPSVVEVKALMAEYGVTPDDPRYETVLTLTRQAQARGWWRRYDDLFSGAYIELEAEASEIRVYEVFAVPGPGCRHLDMRGCSSRPASTAPRTVSSALTSGANAGARAPAAWGKEPVRGRFTAAAATARAASR